MALKKYTKIKGWDNLDKFYDKSVQGVHMMVENFDRVFCRCGETHASEGGIVHKCPACGNTDFIEYGDSNYYTTLPEKVKYIEDSTYAPFTYIINKGRLTPNCATRDSVDFSYDVKPKYKFTKDEIEDLEVPSSTTPRYSYYRDPDVPDELIQKWAYYNDYATIVTEIFGGDCINISTLTAAIKISKTFEVAMKDDLYAQYPSLGKAVIKRLVGEKTSVKPGLGLKAYMDIYGLEKEFYSVYDYCERKNDSGYSGIFSESRSYRYSSYSSPRVPAYKELQELNKNKDIGFSILKTYILNGILSIHEGLPLCKNITDMYSDNPKLDWLSWNSPYKSSGSSRYSTSPAAKDFRRSFPKEIMDLFPFYVKENISVKKDSNICQCFVEDIDTLREMKIAITEENLKVKTMNYYLNRNRLAATYKLPEDKMQVFIDWFEKNPLKAVALIENRRKLTKKQLDSFIELMSED